MKLHIKASLALSVAAVGLAISTLSVMAAPSNLIQNPSMETASSDPTMPQSWFKGGWGTNTRVFTYPVAGYDGTKAAKIEISAYTTGDAKWYFQDVPVTPGQTYEFSDFYMSNVPSLVGTQYKMMNGTVTYGDIALAAASPATWTKVEGNFTVPPNVVSLTVFHVIKQVGFLTTDNFSMSPTFTNLIQNPTFETVNASGDPVGWVKGGFGMNTRSHQRVTCGSPYTEANQLYSIADETGGVFRPSCPPNAKFILQAHLDIPTYVDGDAKWYFTDVPIGTNKNFRVAYQYQAYNYNAEAVARFTYPGGTTSYALISKMPQIKGGAMGYVGWVYAEHAFTAPAGATSVTVFFSAVGGGTCGTTCFSGDHGDLYFANPVLRLQGASEPPAGGADLTPPTASISSPTAGSTVSGITTVSIVADDNVRMGAVRLFVDDVHYGTPDSAFPYSIAWDTTGLSDGPHSIFVTAVDKWGSNIGGSSPITVNVTHAATPTNLISNPSFEIAGTGGDPASWFRGGWGTNARTFTYPTVGGDGNKAAKVQISSYTNGDAKWAFNNVSVTGGKTYSFSDAYKATVTTELGVQYQTPSGPVYQYLASLPATAAWTNVARQITVPANATALTVFHSIYSVGVLETDAFSLTANGP